ncbi:GNAT family N-acetyltransferase [Patescibacteria group bacterium]
MTENDRIYANIDIKHRGVLRKGSWQTEQRQYSSEPILIIGKVGDEKRGTINASLKVEREFDYETESYVEATRYINLGNISVQPKHRHKGLGSAMLKELDNQAGLFGAEKITGNVAPSDIEETPSLLEFYKKNGYAVGERDGGWTVVKIFKQRALH